MDDDLLNMLEPLLGREALVEGRRLCVIEILREGPTLVLKDAEEAIMQESLYGQPRRRAPRLFQVSLRSETGPHLHPVARQFMTEAEFERLKSRLCP